MAGKTLHRPAAGDLSTILIFQPDHLGDIVLSQPAIRLIREQNPDAHLVGVVGPWSREIANIVWAVDELVCIEYPGFTRNKPGKVLDPYRLLRIETRRLRQLRAGRAYVLRPDAWWSAWLAAQSVSGDVVTSNDPRLQPFSTIPVDIRHREHATERALAIAAANDNSFLLRFSNSGLTIPPSEAGHSQACYLLGGLLENPYITLHPGSGARVKHWPVNHWRKLVAELPDLNFVVTGTAGERNICDRLSEGFRNISNLAGKTNLSSLIEIVRHAELAVGTDNGPMHIAVATGTKTVQIFGPSDPRIYGPWGDPRKHRVISAGWNCPRCSDLSSAREEGCGCMLAIPVSNVKAALNEHIVSTI